MANKVFVATIILTAAFGGAQIATPTPRPRASDLGVKVGVLPAGPLDAITDVDGVEVGQTTIIRGENIRTGVTAILPHARQSVSRESAGRDFRGQWFREAGGLYAGGGNGRH